MKRLLLLLFVAGAGLPAKADGLEWLTDAKAAQERARQENKFVMLDFTGSDWCGWCMKLKREVFDQPEFTDFAQANLVPVEVDFPRHKQLDGAQKEANHLLAKTYHITGYPTIVVLDPDGRQVGTTGYVHGGAHAFNAHIEGILSHARKTEPNDRRAQNQAEPPRKSVTFAPIPPAPKVHYDALSLKGISGPKDRRMVLINNADLMVGDKAKVKVQDREIMVCCKEIREDSVVITADDQPMELKQAQQ